MAIDPIFLIGAGGHCRVVADAARASGIDPARLIVRDGRAGLTMFSRPVETPEITCVLSDRYFHVTIGSASTRQLLHTAALAAGGKALTVTHPAAVVASDAMLGSAAFVAGLALVGPGVLIGNGTIINHAAVVDHDCRAGAFCHIAPNATLGGAVTLGDRVVIGAGAVILPGKTIADDVVIGAGAVVLGSIHERGTWVGNPAKRLKS